MGSTNAVDATVFPRMSRDSCWRTVRKGSGSTALTKMRFTFWSSSDATYDFRFQWDLIKYIHHLTVPRAREVGMLRTRWKNETYGGISCRRWEIKEVQHDRNGEGEKKQSAAFLSFLPETVEQADVKSSGGQNCARALWSRCGNRKDRISMSGSLRER